VPESPNSGPAPVFIFVLGGGYLPADNPDEDILVDDSERRVVHGVYLWRRNPNAHIVLSRIWLVTFVNRIGSSD
jgi:hypothetical protein